jgi:hypothetical protein
VGLEKVADLLGHSRLETTHIYTRPGRQDLEQAVESVALSNGKSFKGQLIGADPYSLVIRQSSGLKLMINKGQIVYIHATNSAE